MSRVNPLAVNTAQREDKRFPWASPFRLLTTIAAAIFVVEAFNMVALHLLPPLPLAVEVIGDALILIILTFPVLYYFSYKPLLQHIEKRRAAESALKQSERTLRRLSNQLLKVHDTERHKLAVDLHNELAPKISALKFKVETVMPLVDTDQGPDFELECRRILEMFQDIHADIRSLTGNLSPLMIDELGLLPAVEGLCDRVPDMRPQLRLACMEDDVPAPLKIIIYRVLEEALENIGRHSQAKHVWVSLQREGPQLCLQVKDDGSGFIVEDKLFAKTGEAGIGLSTMCERVSHSGGSFEIDAAPQGGTTISAIWNFGPG